MSRWHTQQLQGQAQWRVPPAPHRLQVCRHAAAADEGFQRVYGALRAIQKHKTIIALRRLHPKLVQGSLRIGKQLRGLLLQALVCRLLRSRAQPKERPHCTGSRDTLLEEFGSTTARPGLCSCRAGASL